MWDEFLSEGARLLPVVVEEGDTKSLDQAF